MPLIEREFDAASGIATLTLNRPEVLNAIDDAIAEELLTATRALERESALRCVVVRGAGRAFAAGGDLSRFAAGFERAEQHADKLLDSLDPSVQILRRLDAPVVASVHGSVAGAGLSLMTACDLVLAAEGTRFLAAYDRVGANPDWGGTYFLPRAMGLRRAAQFFMLSEVLDAQQALEAGLVNFVVPADQLAQRTQETARKLASGPTRAYGAYKRLSAATLNASLPDQLAAERASFKALTRTEDFREGVTAFLSKRPPEFKGR